MVERTKRCRRHLRLPGRGNVKSKALGQMAEGRTARYQRVIMQVAISLLICCKGNLMTYARYHDSIFK